jgi:hypothetical protein
MKCRGAEFLQINTDVHLSGLNKLTQTQKPYLFYTSYTKDTNVPLPTSIAKLHGAALIAPTYHIVVKVTDPSSYSFYFTHICAIDNATEVPLARVHRSISTAINDWRYENLQWNSTNPNRGLCVRFRINAKKREKGDGKEKRRHVIYRI